PLGEQGGRAKPAQSGFGQPDGANTVSVEVSERGGVALALARDPKLPIGVETVLRPDHGAGVGGARAPDHNVGDVETPARQSFSPGPEGAPNQAIQPLIAHATGEKFE